jgi:putative ABC transport system substrate-binding protein
MKRREFITLLGGAVTTAWPLAAHAQQPAMPVVGFVSGRSNESSVRDGGAFRKALNETGYVEGQNVMVEYHWLDGQYDRLPALMAELVRRRVAVIATPGFGDGALAAKAATATIPIVFGVAQDPVKLGLVASLARPGGNATGINLLSAEIGAKRLGLLHDLVPKAVRIAVLVNPANSWTAEATLRDIPDAARATGLQIQVLKASTRSEIEAAFATLVRDRADALLVASDGFFTSRRVQFATLAARYAIPAAYSNRSYPEVGGLMSYGTDSLDYYRQAGVYTGQILKGAKPADMPVLQSTKWEFVINMQTARALGLEVPNSLQLLADEFTLLGSAAVAWPVAGSAQPGERVRRVGVITGAGVDADDADMKARFAAFAQALEQLGWSHGRNVQIDYRFGSGNPDDIRRHAVELAALAPDVILSSGAASVGPTLQVTRTIPVVFVGVVDPVGAGFVDSMAQPGGNATGFVMLEYSMTAKYLELLKEIAPFVTRVAILRDAAISSGTGQFGAIQSAAPSLRMDVTPVNVRDARVIERSVATFAQASNGGLIATASALTVVHRELIIGLAARYKLPAVFHRRLFVASGGLMSYGADVIDQFRQAAGYVDRILKGEKPADLPVQAPTSTSW